LVRDLIAFDRQSVVPSLSILLSAALACVLVSAAVAGPQMVSHQLERAAARQPVFAEESGEAGPGEPSVWQWELPVGEETLTWIFVQLEGNDIPRPPGVPEWPSPGQSIGSPAVVELAAADAEIAAALPPLAGLVSRDGLVRPRELVIWTSLESARGGESRPSFDRFGARVQLPEHLDRQFRPLYVAILGLFVGVPLVVSVAAGSRASERVRRARSRALELVGAPSWVSRICVAVEVGAPASLGAIFGVALTRQLWRWAERRDWAYAGDIELSTATTLMIVCGLFAVMALVAVSVLSEPASGHRRRTPAWVAGSIGLAVAASLVLFRQSQSTTLRLLIWPLAVLGVGVALFVGASRLVQVVATAGARVARWPAWLAAFRQLEASPRAVTDVHLTMAAFTVTVVGLGPLAGIVFDQVATTSMAVDARSTYPAVTATADVPADLVAQMTSIRDAVGIDDTTGEVLASCRQMRSLLNEPALQCDQMSRWMIANDYAKVPGLESLTIDPPQDLPFLQLRSAALEQPSFLVRDPPGPARDRPDTSSSLIGLDSDQRTIDRFRLEFTKRFPAHQPARVALDTYLLGQASIGLVAELISVVAVAGIISTAAATLILFVPMAEDRRPLQDSWRTIGAPNTFLVGSQLVFYGVPAVILLVVGTGTTVALVGYFLRTMGISEFVDTRYWLAVLMSTALSSIVVVAAAWMTCRQPDSIERNAS
jgi:hypothetical protein